MEEELYTQAQIVKKLNKEVPKDQKPRSGKITTANFSMKLRNGAFTHTGMKGASKLYRWEDVAPHFGIGIINVDEIIENVDERTNEIISNLTSTSGVDEILENFKKNLKERLSLTKIPRQQTEIEKMSYDALLKQLDVKQKLGELIAVDEAKATLEYILSNTKAKFYELPSKLKTRFTQLKDNDIHEIQTMIDDIFKDISTNGF